MKKTLGLVLFLNTLCVGSLFAQGADVDPTLDSIRLSLWFQGVKTETVSKAQQGPQLSEEFVYLLEKFDSAGSK